MRIRDEQPGSYFLELKTIFLLFWGVKILKFFEDPGSGMETVGIRDPGWKKVGSGIRDKHPGSATLKNLLLFSFHSKFTLNLITNNLAWEQLGIRIGVNTLNLFVF
jgi:hypothetical protein